MAKPKITKELIDRAIAWDPAAVREIVTRVCCLRTTLYTR